MTPPDDILLGKEVAYQFEYDASLLFPIARDEGRHSLGIQSDSLPFYGIDRWTAYELSWLNCDGLPQVAIAEFDFPCESTNLIESKSLKLYLNSLNQTQLAGKNELQQRLEIDLSACSGAQVAVRLFDLDNYPITDPQGYICIDQQALSCEQYQPNAQLLKINKTTTEQKLCSHLLRSLCPVTGQPDWATLYIHYKGVEIDQASLLEYIVSYRNHQGFHEQCVEQVYQDIQQQCQPELLSVYARYLRRGGLDINPCRSSVSGFQLSIRDSRQ